MEEHILNPDATVTHKLPQCETIKGISILLYTFLMTTCSACFIWILTHKVNIKEHICLRQMCPFVFCEKKKKSGCIFLSWAFTMKTPNKTEYNRMPYKSHQAWSLILLRTFSESIIEQTTSRARNLLDKCRTINLIEQTRFYLNWTVNVNDQKLFMQIHRI